MVLIFFKVEHWDLFFKDMILIATVADLQILHKIKPVKHSSMKAEGTHGPLPLTGSVDS